MLSKFFKHSLLATCFIFSLSNPAWTGGKHEMHWSESYTDRSRWPYDYKSTCYFNNIRKKCTVMHYAGRYNISKNNHAEIAWEDGDITTIRFLGGLKKGKKVLLNNQTPGIIKSAGGLMNDKIILQIKSSTGNVIRFSFIG